MSAPTGQQASRSRSWWPQPQFSHLLTDAASIEQLNADAGLAVTFVPILHSDIQINLSGSQTSSVSVWETVTRTGFASRPKIALPVTAIRLIHSGTMTRHCHDKNEFSQDVATLTNFLELDEEVFSGGFHSSSITLPTAAIQRAALHLDLIESEPSEDFLPVLNLDERHAKAFRGVARSIGLYISSGAIASGPMLALLQDLVATHVAAFWPRARPVPPNVSNSSAGKRTLADATDYITTNLHRELTLSSISAACGVSIRALQRVFRSELSTTPLTFILDARLDGVHRDLIDPLHRNVSISKIARRWAFSHMGDFGRRYKIRFGETASQTRDGSKR